jgi:hypothetical protein
LRPIFETCSETKKAAGIEHQHAEIGMAVNFFCAVRAEHPCANHDRIESNAPVVHRFIPSVTNETAHDIDRECRLLNGDGLIDFLQTI